MSIVNYKSYNLPGSYREVIANINSCAIDWGWTVDEYKDGYVWNSGWSVGDGCFLQLYSAAYGSQGTYNQWRIYAYYDYAYYVTNHSGDTTEFGDLAVFDFGQQNRANSTYEDVENNPTLQDNLLYRYARSYTYGEVYRKLTMNHSALIKQWVFGSINFIYSIIQVDSTYCVHIFFGVPELFDTTHAYGQCCMLGGMPFQLFYTGGWQSYTTNDNLPYGFCCINNGAQAVTSHNVTGARVSMVKWFGLPPASIGYGDLYDEAITINSWSGKRVMKQPILWGYNASTYRALGYMPWANVITDGLTIGHDVVYGTDHYLVFPFYEYSLGGNYCGVAFRVS